MRTRRLTAIAALAALFVVGLPVLPPAAAQAATRIMLLGDSITQGNNGEHTWRYRFDQHLRSAGVAFDLVGSKTAPYTGSYAAGDWDTDHEATWGLNVWQAKDSVRAWVAAAQPDYLLVHLGTNDLVFTSTPATVVADTVANMTQLITNARAAKPSIKVLVAKIIPRASTPEQRVLDYNNALQGLEADLSTDTSPVRVTDAFTGYDPAADSYDGTHPNPRGEYKIAAAFANGMDTEYGVGRAFGAIPAVDDGPPAPQNVAATPGNGSATISWNAVAGATSYSVYMRDETAGAQSWALVQYGVTGTSWTQTMMINGHTYNYYVTAVKVYAESLPSEVVQVVPDGPRPATPTGVSVTGGNMSATVRWNAVSGVDSYNVYMKGVTDGDDGFALVQFGVTGTSWTQTLLINGRVYDYFVTAVKGGTESLPSDTVRVVAGGPPPPTPTGVSVTGGSGTATVRWSAVSGAESYRVYMKDVTAGDNGFALVQFGVTGTSWTQTLLINGHTYDYYVTAIRQGGESAPSQVVRVVPSPPRPAAPTGVGVTPGNSRATVRWNAVSGATSYSVYMRDVTAGDGYSLVQFGVTGTSWTQTLLWNGRTYAYYVTAVNAGVESVASAVVQVVPFAPRPAAPTGVTATAGNARATVRWNGVSGADSYKVYMRDLTSGKGWALVQWNVTGTSWTQTLLWNGYRYQYYVTAVKDGAESLPSSASKTVVPFAPPPATPTGVSVTPGEGSATVRWNSVSGATSYSVFMREYDQSTFTFTTRWKLVQFGITGTSWTQIYLQQLHSYCYYVTAVNIDGESKPSASRCASPLFTSLDWSRTRQYNWADGAPSGASRGAFSVPAQTDRGIMVARFYIKPQGVTQNCAAYCILAADGRGWDHPDAYASSRVTMAWETGTGRVMVTVSRSCFVLGGCVNALPVNQTYCLPSAGCAAHNQFTFSVSGGAMTIGYHAVNSITSQGPILAGYFPIRGNITFRPSGGSFNIDFYGVRYSSLEIWQYRRYDRYAVNRGGFSQGSPIADANLFSTSRSYSWSCATHGGC